MARDGPTADDAVFAKNRILAGLPAAEAAGLRPHLQTVSLEMKDVLYDANRPIEHAWFMTRGVASMTKSMADGAIIEIATVGPEGMVGLPVFLGSSTIPSTAFIQIPGEGLRIGAAALRKALDSLPTLRDLLHRYALALLNQVAQSSACNRVHSVDERCARWILMTHDRVHGASFPLTQEFLGQMLGVRRPTVSIAASMLMKAGLIQYSRGVVTVTDRPGLEAAACECYRAIVTEYDQLLGGHG